MARGPDTSRTGMLFRAEDLLEVDTVVEMSFILPPADLGPEVFCHGRVVRTVPPETPEPGLAATIADYRIVREEPAPSQS